MAAKPQVLIDPRSDILYSSWFFEGLKQLYKKQVGFSLHNFPVSNKFGLFAFTITDSKGKRKIVIDHLDDPLIDEEMLTWADVYSKVNLKHDEQRNKIIPAGVFCGIRSYGIGELSTLLPKYFLHATLRPLAAQQMRSFYRQWKYRLPEASFKPTVSSNNYIFFCASLWKKEQQNNHYRRLFIDACHGIPGLDFEGGFAPRSNNDIPGFEDYTDRSYTYSEYLDRTARSLLVFNSPAVRSCHSWKLAENLAMGKAIISLPFERQLSSPLVHGEHIHFVTPEKDAIQEAIEQIAHDNAYRAKLEQGARSYYEACLRPASHVKRIIEAALK